MKIRILSASRRTDIPAFYGSWLMNRVRAGWCAVPNPFNSKQVARIEIDPRDTLFVFWTRWAAPFMNAVADLESLGFRFYFQYTLVNNPPLLDPKSPPFDKAVAAFCRLAGRIGPERVIWRYDPILLSEATNPDFHLENFDRIARSLDGATKRVVVSIVDPYDKAARRLARLGEERPDFRYRAYDPRGDAEWLGKMAGMAKEHGLVIQSCAEEFDLTALGIEAGKCIDDRLIQQLFGIDVSHKKDKGQRDVCGCVESRDIGMYDSCLFGCVYCYATRSFDAARSNHAAHDPDSESLIGQYRAALAKEKSAPSNTTVIPIQADLFHRDP